MNINFKWLTPFDLKGRFKITENVPQKDFDIAVRDAFNFDIATALSDDMMEDIKEVLETNPIQWSGAKAYVIDDIVVYDGVFYKSLGSHTGSLPPSVNWSEIQLLTFWTDFVKPYFEACAYYRFLLWHGANVTQYGSRQNNEDTSIEISDKRKGELLADIKGKQDILLARLTKRFSDVNGTLDGVQYEYDIDDTQEKNNLTGIKMFTILHSKIRFHLFNLANKLKNMVR